LLSVKSKRMETKQSWPIPDFHLNGLRTMTKFRQYSQYHGKDSNCGSASNKSEAMPVVQSVRWTARLEAVQHISVRISIGGLHEKWSGEISFDPV